MSTHRQLQDAIGGGPCDLDTDADWPYECNARDKHPDHRVIVCRNHMVWWHEPRQSGTGG